nr:unnamed protein product [Callosobruchus analis]
MPNTYCVALFCSHVKSLFKDMNGSRTASLGLDVSWLISKEYVSKKQIVISQIVAECDVISDAQAVDSDVEGECDADDNLPLTKQFASKSKPITRSKLGIKDFENVLKNMATTTSNDIYEDDSDDSVRDSDYEYSGSDSESDVVKANEPREPLEQGSDDEQEDDAEDGEDVEFIWTKIESQPKTYTNFNYNQPQGVNNVLGLTDETRDSSQQYFLAIFSDIVYKMILTESNKYATQKGITLNLQQDELQSFLLNDNEVMPQRGDENFDRLYKVRPLVEILNERFSSLYAPYRELSIDESMVGFKGRITKTVYAHETSKKRI